MTGPPLWEILFQHASKSAFQVGQCSRTTLARLADRWPTVAMAKGLISRGVAGVAGIAGFPLFVFVSACGGNTDAGASPEADEPNLPNESRTLAEPNVNTGAVDRNGNDQSAGSGSSTAEVEHSSAAAAPTTEATHGEPASTHTAAVDTSAFDGGVTGAGSTLTNTDVADADGTQANLECADEGCETACESGFVSYPDLDAGRCLKVCDLTNLLPLDNQDKVAALAAQQCAVIEEGTNRIGSARKRPNGLGNHSPHWCRLRDSGYGAEFFGGVVQSRSSWRHFRSERQW